MTKASARNIDFVNESKMCTECGACFGVCPRDNISVKFNNRGEYKFRTIDSQACVNCGLCYDICPGAEVDFDTLNEDIFSLSMKLDSPYSALGCFQGTFLGHAMDDQIREKAASGGITSALLCYALETGKIDGVYMVRMRNAAEDDPLSPEVYLASTKQEILAGQQSKYITVPLDRVLRDIIRSGKNKKYAFVGIACQMHGLRKAERLIPKLRKRIVLRLGLFCSHTMNRLGTEHLLRLVKADKQEIEHVEYRAREWPGAFMAVLRDGREKWISHPVWSSYVLTSYEKWRCHFCIDPLNQLSDISVGDAWLEEMKGRKGENIVIARSAKGSQFLHEAASKGFIELSKLPPQKVIESQRRVIYRKRHLIFAYMKLAKCLGRMVPSYKCLESNQKLELRGYFETLILEIARSIVAREELQWAIPWLVKLFFRLKSAKINLTRT